MLPVALKAALEKWSPSPVVAAQPAGGGSIAESYKIHFADGRSVFVKTYAYHALLAAEAEGLREIALSHTVPVPEVLAVTDEFLALEWLEEARPSPDFWEELARGLAKMHGHTGSSFGFKADNFIGSTPQKNTPVIPHRAGDTNQWADFFWEYRLLFQWRRAETNSLVSKEMSRHLARLEKQITKILCHFTTPPALLHGDLWSGNVLAGPRGAFVIDPAVYYGDPETDLAMTRLFGGFPANFYRAYEECREFTPGWRERDGIYKLYHLLNHLNLFGRSYQSAIMEILNQYG